MNADTINAIMNMATVQNLSSQSMYSDSKNNSGSDFSSMLSSMLGTEASGTQSALAGLGSSATVDYAALLNSATGGLRLQDVQNNAMAEAIQALMDAEKPMVTDPVLAQLLQMMKNLNPGTDDADIMDLIGQMQQRLKEMLEEEGTTMASQQALALMNQLLPMFAGQQADGMSETLNAAGGQAALDLMLQKSPAEMAGLLSGQPAQSTEAQVLNPEATGTSQVQTDFSQIANGTAGNPQPVNPEDGGELRVASVDTEAQPQQTFADMLETGKAQGDFASAVRTVKDQMADNESTGFQEELDADDLQRQVNAGDVNRTVRTSYVNEAPAEVRETPQSVPAQLEQAIGKGLAAGEEQIVVKLNPEELGEVTIQMQRAQDGNFILNIIAKNPETQRILASELAQLQQNLRPMNVEVESITTEQQYEMANAQQQFGGQHQRTWKEMHGAAYYGDETLSAQAEQEITPSQPQLASTSVLDAYI